MNWSNMQPTPVTSRWSLPWGIIFWAIIIIVVVYGR